MLLSANLKNFSQIKAYTNTYQIVKNSYFFFTHSLVVIQTTSGFFFQGKQSFFEIFEARLDLEQKVQAFTLEPNLEKIVEAGIECTLALYQGKHKISNNLTPEEKLDLLRFTIFMTKNAKRINKLKKQLANPNLVKKPKNPKKNKTKIGDLPLLPPTVDALEQHLKRVYYQIREWIGSLNNHVNPLNPEDWGWKKVGDILQPVKMTQPMAPNSVFDVIICACQTGCEKNCSCRKSELECSPACVNCYGSSCKNTAAAHEEDEEETEMHILDVPAPVSECEDESDCDEISHQDEETADH